MDNKISNMVSVLTVAHRNLSRPCGPLITMNDVTFATFNEIADYIEREVA